MPSAPPSVARIAAATGSGSAARRACRTVATWSMFTPSRIIMGSYRRKKRDLGAVPGRLALQRLVDQDHEEKVQQVVQGSTDEVVEEEVLHDPDDDERD